MLFRSKTWAVPDNIPQWIVPENGLYLISAHFCLRSGNLTSYKYQIIILDSLSELAVYGNDQSTTYSGSLEEKELVALVPLNKGTKISFSVWSGESGAKVEISQWHVLLRKGITDKIIKTF